ncbi:MAG TPA: thioesterase family protein [Azospirillaceae bacterium]|nr:thioesterase family protein [Azospirillaceae bacterium]
MGFRHTETVRFGHVDGAGIVFHPRYCEWVNNTIEAWFSDGIGYSFTDLHLRDGHAIPLLESHYAFRKASRLGDVLTFTLTVTEMKRATFDVRIVCTGPEGDERMSADIRMVHVRLEPMKSADIPDWLRAKMEAFRAAPRD